MGPFLSACAPLTVHRASHQSVSTPLSTFSAPVSACLIRLGGRLVATVVLIQCAHPVRLRMPREASSYVGASAGDESISRISRLRSWLRRTIDLNLAHMKIIRVIIELKADLDDANCIRACPLVRRGRMIVTLLT